MIKEQSVRVTYPVRQGVSGPKSRVGEIPKGLFIDECNLQVTQNLK